MYSNEYAILQNQNLNVNQKIIFKNRILLFIMMLTICVFSFLILRFFLSKNIQTHPLKIFYLSKMLEQTTFALEEHFLATKLPVSERIKTLVKMWIYGPIAHDLLASTSKKSKLLHIWLDTNQHDLTVIFSKELILEKPQHIDGNVMIASLLKSLFVSFQSLQSIQIHVENQPLKVLPPDYSGYPIIFFRNVYLRQLSLS